MALVRPPLSAPGVYVQEVPSGVRTITGVSTSLTVFLGRTARGPVVPGNAPVRISSFEEFEHIFGGLSRDYPLSYSVQDFFLNGGAQAVILRLFKGDADAASATIKFQAEQGRTGQDALDAHAPEGLTDEQKKNFHPKLQASSPGAWGNRLTYAADKDGITSTVIQRYATREWKATDLFNLTVTYPLANGRSDTERFTNVSLNDKAGARKLSVVLEQTSRYARFVNVDSTRTGADSQALTPTEYEGGLEQLDRLDVYNLVCIPPDTFDGNTTPAVYTAAAARCVKAKATLIIDPPNTWSSPDKVDPENFGGDIGVTPASDQAAYCALYYPRVVTADPLSGGASLARSASGMLAGIIARTDASRGVWKAPAGYEAGISGISGLAVTLTDAENGTLNSLGVNCLRSFSPVGPVVWGARTLAGSDVLASDFKYLPVRRLTDYIEQTLLRQTRWAVFEPNDEPLWSQLRLAIGSFMNDLFRQGAFQGSSRDQAFFVKCDSSNTTQDDINRGIVNIEVGFAPLKPAEFVVIYIEQMAGQTA